MFITLSILLAAAVAFLGWCIFRPQMAVKMPRWKVPGILLGGIVLGLCVHEGCLLLEGDLAKYQNLVIVLGPLAVIGAWFLLDYLFARALGGIMAFLANYLLHLAFVDECAWRPFYSIVVLIWGVLGLWFVATPWWLRISYEKMSEKKWLRQLILAACAVSVLVLILLPLF